MIKQIPDEKLNKTDGGFSLLEVIISVAILALVTIPLLNYFMDSLEHSARMARRQQATLAAQEVTEKLKAVDMLIQPFKPATGEEDSSDDTRSVYTVPYLFELLGIPYSNLENDDYEGKFGDDGKGEAVFEGSLTTNSGTFDVRVTVSTDVPANDVQRPLIFGIDDTRDVFILEQSQKEEVLAYFTAANIAAGGLLSQSEIENSLTRIMHINVGYELESSEDIENDKNGYFTVQAQYEYKCNALNDTYFSTYLKDVRLSSLQNIYLLFNSMAGGDQIKLNISDQAVALFEDEDEDMSFEVDPITYKDICLGLYLISQNFDDLIDAGESCSLELTGHRDWISVHSNLSSVENGNNEGTEDNVVPKHDLAGNGTPTRLISLTTEIFKKDHDATDEALAVIETTKGE